MPTRDKILAVYAGGPEAVVAPVEQLQALLLALTERVVALEARLAKDNHNSHQPPAGDGPARKTRSLRQKNDKKSGGQPGDPGSTVLWGEHPDRIAPHAPTGCQQGYAPSSEPPAIKVLILCSTPIIAWALEKFLEGGPRLIQTHTVVHLGDSDDIGDFDPQVVIVVPQTWEEMSRLLPQADRRFGLALWLVYSRLRVAGMFGDALAGHSCNIVGWHATPAEFRASFWGLLRYDPDCPPASLLALINRSLWAVRRVPGPVELTARQLQCGCAVSLGLSNAQIAASFSIAEGTVAKHVSALLHALDVPDREELGALFEHAFFPEQTLPHFRVTQR
jgi:DNA-binding CsgD family transcriptional regulator